MTESGVLLHYLRLCVWPHPLRGAYDEGIVRDLGAALPAMLVLTALFAGTVWQWRQRPWLGWLGALFFLLLGPTSSVMPIVTEVAAERRMYLPMLSVLVPVALLASRLAPVPAMRWTLGALVVVPSILATRTHVRTYADERSFWTAAGFESGTSDRSLVASMILGAQARLAHEEGRPGDALALLEQAMQCEAVMDRTRLLYGRYLQAAGRLAEAEVVLRDMIELDPTLAAPRALLAFVLVAQHEAAMARGQAGPSDPRLVEAVNLASSARSAVEDPATLNTLGMALSRQGRLPEAEGVLREALRLDPDLLDAKKSLGAVLCFGGRTSEGVALLQQVADARPKEVSLRLAIAHAHMQTGNLAAAEATLQEVLRVSPDHPAALQLLDQLRGGGR
jgi:Flp pilus assembly protein TadD